jgi:hypothetical protein
LFLIGRFKKKHSPLKSFGQMNQNLVVRTYGRFYKKFPQNRMKVAYQVSVDLAKRFQRRRFFLEINQSETRIAVVAMFVPKLGQNEHSLERTSHRCFLPSFGSFGQVVSEERIFITTTQKQELPVATMQF